MRPLKALSHLVFLLLASSTSHASILEDACKSFAAGHKDVGYDYCIKFFQANKGSATADKPGLAVIATKITGAAAESISKHITALRASEKDKKMQECLSSCDELYSDTIDNLAEAVKGIASGKAEGLQDAVTYLSGALDAPGTCEDGFGELKVTSPLAAEDSEFVKEVSIALAVTVALSPARK